MHKHSNRNNGPAASDTKSTVSAHSTIGSVMFGKKWRKKPCKTKVPDLALMCMFVTFAVVICAVIVVVCYSSSKLYSSLKTATENTITRASNDAASHICSELSGLEPVAKFMATVTATALQTARAPATSEEAESYQILQSDQDGEMTVISSVTDFGGPVTVLYHAEHWNSTQQQEIIEAWFWRTGGMGVTLQSLQATWDSRVFQTYYVSDEGFAALYPFTDLSATFIDLPSYDFHKIVQPDKDPNDTIKWTIPYVDAITGQWIVTVSQPISFAIPPGVDSSIYNIIDGYPLRRGEYAMDVFLTSILSYAATASNELPWDAYVVICSSDGTLLAIPEQGYQDWSGERDFNYTQELLSPNYNVSEWNILTSSRYSHLAKVISAYINVESKTTTDGSSMVTLPGGKRLVSWSGVPGSGWVVIATVDQHKALHTQHACLILTIVMACAMGAMLLFAVLSSVVYFGFKQQYTRMSNKIEDLNSQLIDLQCMVDTMKASDHAEYEQALHALSGGVNDIVRTLEGLAKTLPQSQAHQVHAAIDLLIHRERAPISTKNLNSEQLQFVIDCGIDVKKQKASSSVATTPREPTLEMLKKYAESVPSGVSSAFQILPPATPITVDDISTWEFDLMNLAKEFHFQGVLTSVAFTVAVKEGVVAPLADVGATAVDIEDYDDTDNYVSHSIDAHKFAEFLSLMDATYCGENREVSEGAVQLNPYHNHVHAADVVQCMHHLLNVALQDMPELKASMTQLDHLACIIAAACHDYGHPGRNSVFLRSSLDRKHILYGGDSPLERYHISRAFGLLFEGPEQVRALNGLRREDILTLHALVSKLILATDMARHVEILDSFNAWTTQWVPQHSKEKQHVVIPLDEKQKLLVLQLIIKASDISNAFRPWHICKEWTMNLVNEFSQQCQDERELGLPVSKMMDGSISPGKMQESFIPVIVVPLLRALQAVFPGFSTFEKIAWDNLENWKHSE